MGVVIEVGVDVEAIVEVVGDSFGGGGEGLRGVVAVVAGAMEAEVEEVGGGEEGVMFEEVVDAEGDTMFAQEVVDGIAEPGGIAQFDGPALGGGQMMEEVGESGRVNMPMWGEVDEDGPKGLLEAFGAAEEEVDGALGVFEMFEVGAVAAEFKGVNEVLGCAAAPIVEGFGLRESVEGVVDFDGVEMLGVMFEPLRGGQVGGIEDVSPMVVLVSAGADAQGGLAIGHGGVLA